MAGFQSKSGYIHYPVGGGNEQVVSAAVVLATSHILRARPNITGFSGRDFYNEAVKGRHDCFDPTSREYFTFDGVSRPYDS